MTTHLSLVVCTLGRREPLARFLDSLRGQSDTGFDIVLVDQNADGFLDPTLDRHGDGLAIEHLRSAPGLSRARNVGIRAARGEVLGFPDDDCWYGPDTVAAVKQCVAARPDVDVVTGRTTDASGADSVSPQLGSSRWVNRGNIFLAGNSNTVFVRRAAAARVGGFDENLGVGAGTPYQSGEETDFLLRCLTMGCKIWHDHNLRIFHDQSNESGPARIARARTYSIGFGRVVRSHGYGFPYLGVRLGRTALRATYCLLRGDMDGAQQRYAWAMGSIKGYLAPLPRQSRTASSV